MNADNVEWSEIETLFEAIYKRYGYDFRQYSRDSARRRVYQRVQYERLGSIPELQQLVIADKKAADALLKTLSINVTEMFRDPLFFKALRSKALPLLDEYSHLKIWHAGCATGEEVYSMAILLSEEGRYESSLLYGTDFNNSVLKRSQNGIFPLDGMRINSRNYHSAGGQHSLADYFHSNYNGAAMTSALKKNMVFAHHNLAIDECFAEMQMVICRNVLIYFDQALQQRVFKLFDDSLCVGGILCLGSHETLRLVDDAWRFEVIDSDQRIFRKVA
jgi:chemotaxis protein methyltransferase CheR